MSCMLKYISIYYNAGPRTRPPITAVVIGVILLLTAGATSVILPCYIWRRKTRLVIEHFTKINSWRKHEGIECCHTLISLHH